MDIILLDERTLVVGQARYCCAIGKARLADAADKREGDCKTPRGTYGLRACYYRPDKCDPPNAQLPLVPIRQNMGWCDDSSHPRYNQLVRLPFSASHEKLWRDDDCYDLIVPIGYNDDPIVSGRGSAIFLHIAKPEYEATEGCVALSKQDLLEVLKHIDTDSQIVLS